MKHTDGMATLPRVVLASSSPRRLELMRMIGLDPEVRPPQVAEVLRAGEDKMDFIQRVTLEKGRSAAQAGEEDVLVVSADTVVILNDTIVGKPRSRDHAREILHALSGKMHQVWTAVALFRSGREWLDVERTRVWFATLTATEIERYLDREHYQDKAGAYAIQGRAAVFVKRIDGCYFNVMGFPLRLFYTLSAAAGIDLMQPSPVE
ncbi:MAG: nucleoside triphosphate pyrophosphatase [Acidobacteriota bacterium]|jgi:septum formation protein|nr:nucleoside triphosphate pyrophosphatase [Acidobacteriota bacterium]